MRDAVNAMKRMFPGVRGRLIELCNVTEKRFTLAASIVLGKHIDAIVVDTEAVRARLGVPARACPRPRADGGGDVQAVVQCINHLRVNRIGILDFIPLDKVRLKPVEEKLRTLGPAYRLAEQVLRFDPAVERAVRYACGSAIIADTRADARALRFGGRSEEVKVVSADDGTLFAKNATMTGGLSSDETGRSARWDAAALEELKRQVCWGDMHSRIVCVCGGGGGGKV